MARPSRGGYIYKRPESTHFWACYRSADGKRRRFSTGKIDPNEATMFLSEMMATEKEATAGTLTRNRATVVLDRILERSTGESLGRATFREFAGRWLAGKELRNAPGGFMRFESTVKTFLTFLGDRADSPIATIRHELIEDFQRHRIAAVRASTANHDLKTIRTLFGDAVKQGQLQFNPVANIAFVPENDSVEKLPFTDQEVRRLIDAASGDWKPLIRLGRFTGLRIGDASNLKWKSVDLANDVIRIVPQKTKASALRARKPPKELRIPIHEELKSFLLELPTTDDPETNLFPTLANRQTSGKTGLSCRFNDIVDTAGVDPGIVEREGGRNIRARSFHSLRVTMASVLANVGADEGNLRDILGHSGVEMPRRYVKRADSTLAKEVAKLHGLTPDQHQPDQGTV